MKRPRIIWIISLGLILNGIYQFVIVAQSSYYTSVAAWGILSFAGAIGLLLEREWSKYLILLVSLFSLTGWIDGTIRAFQNGPPYGTLRDNIMSFVPALFLISWWVCISLYVLKYFNNIKNA